MGSEVFVCWYFFSVPCGLPCAWMCVRVLL